MEYVWSLNVKNEYELLLTFLFSSKLERSKHDNQHAQLTKWPRYFTFLTAIILGDKDVYIDVGSSLNLACNVKQIDCVYPCDPYDPQFIIWMKNNKVSVFVIVVPI